MPTFARPAVAGFVKFEIAVTITDPGQVVSMRFDIATADADGLYIGSLAGDLQPYLTPAQIASFTAAALALYAKAKAELLT